MAGAGYKLFNTGDVLTAAQVNTYLQEQTVMVFANATARTTALSGVLAEGMMSYLQDTNAVEVYDGSAWVSVGSTGDITGVTAGTGISGGGTSGTVTITNDMATTITAAGDIVVGTGSGTYDNLPIGTTGQVLTADTTVSPYKVKWAAAASGSTFVGASAYKSSNQTVTNTTWTAITYNAEYWDTDAFHDNSTNTSRFTIPSGKAGKYLITVNVGFVDKSEYEMALAIYKNGSVLNSPGYIGVTESKGAWIFGNIVVDGAVNDYFEIYIFISSNSNEDINYSNAQISYLGA